MLLQCLLQACAMKLEKPNYRAVLFRIAMTEVWDISSGLGNFLLSAIQIYLFISKEYVHTSPLTHNACVAPVWVPYILRWGCYELLTSVHQGSVLGSRRLLAV